jgi:hypothetical protein
MMSRFVLIWTVWSLVAAPALCRAGVLAACCTHGEPANAEQTCCASAACAPADLPADSAPQPRDCESCAEVCKAAAKPAEKRAAADCFDVARNFLSDVPGIAVMSCVVQAGPRCHERASRTNLACLASDLPLRI